MTWMQIDYVYELLLWLCDIVCVCYCDYDLGYRSIMAFYPGTTRAMPRAGISLIKYFDYQDGNNNGGTTSNDISAPSIYFNIVQIHKTKL